MILCGAKQVDITPPIGVRLGGYGAREENSKGIHDSLFAQLIYLSDLTTEILLIGMDLLAVNADFTNQVRSEIHKKTQIPEDAILVSCTHTHSGPDWSANLFALENLKINHQHREMTLEKLSGASLWAKNAAKEVRLSFVVEKVTDIGTNRNDKAKPIDQELSILRIDAHEKPYAVIVNYGCHPTVMGADNLFISADLPGAARNYLAKLYPSAVMMFLNGGAGDVSTRFTRRSQGFEELDRFGLILFSAIVGGMQKAFPLAVDQVNYLQEDINLPVRNLPQPAKAQEILAQYEEEYLTKKEKDVRVAELRVAETKVQGARRQVELSKLLRDTNSISSELQAVLLGELILLTIPGEPYAEISRLIKKAFPEKVLMVVSYANDYQGYFPLGTENETYETLKSPWPSDIGNYLIEKSKRLVENLLNKTQVERGN